MKIDSFFEHNNSISVAFVVTAMAFEDVLF
jgi:hypothetical protein